MASGGVRARSGPAPDPNALRRSRPGDDAEWTTIPRDARVGADAPEWPLDAPMSGYMQRRWVDLWSKPQASIWARDEMVDLIAAYVLAFDESVQPGASAGLKTAVLRMEAELGISMLGMRANKWRLGDVADEAAVSVSAPVADIRSRLRK